MNWRNGESNSKILQHLIYFDRHCKTLHFGNKLTGTFVNTKDNRHCH